MAEGHHEAAPHATKTTTKSKGKKGIVENLVGLGVDIVEGPTKTVLGAVEAFGEFAPGHRGGGKKH